MLAFLCRNSQRSTRHTLLIVNKSFESITTMYNVKYSRINNMMIILINLIGRFDFERIIIQYQKLYLHYLEIS